MSDYLWSHGLQHTRLRCPSPIPGACSNSCPSSRWCHPTISSSVVPFSSCLQSFPASGSFPVSQFFTSGGQSIGASASVLPMNIQGWYPLGLTGLISLQSKGLSRIFSNTTVEKQAVWCDAPLRPQIKPKKPASQTHQLPESVCFQYWLTWRTNLGPLWREGWELLLGGNFVVTSLSDQVSCHLSSKGTDSERSPQ